MRHALPFRARRFVAQFALTLSAVLAAEAPVSAQGDADLESIAAARSLGVEGVKLADAGRCADAVEKLARAERLHHAPSILGRLGECQVHLGKIVEGTENLARVVREPLPANAPPAYVKAKARAQIAYDAAKPRIAKLLISVKAFAQGEFTVTLDGQPLSSLLLDVDRPTDPGEHVVEARGEGFMTASSSVTLAEGQRGTVLLKLEGDASASPVAVSSAASKPVTQVTPAAAPLSSELATTESAQTAPRATSRAVTAAYVAFGLGAAAFATGGVFGALALSGRSDVENECPRKICPPSSRETLNSTRTYGTASTIAFAAGAGFVIAGAILWFTSPSSPSDERIARTARVAPWVGPTSAGASLSGSF
jgi:hypothetical protein